MPTFTILLDKFLFLLPFYFIFHHQSSFANSLSTLKMDKEIDRDYVFFLLPNSTYEEDLFSFIPINDIKEEFQQMKNGTTMEPLANTTTTTTPNSTTTTESTTTKVATTLKLSLKKENYWKKRKNEKKLQREITFDGAVKMEGSKHWIRTYAKALTDKRYNEVDSHDLLYETINYLQSIYI